MNKSVQIRVIRVKKINELMCSNTSFGSQPSVLFYDFMLRKNLKITQSDRKVPPVRLSDFSSNEERIAIAKIVPKSDRKVLARQTE